MRCVSDANDTKQKDKEKRNEYITLASTPKVNLISIEHNLCIPIVNEARGNNANAGSLHTFGDCNDEQMVFTNTIVTAWYGRRARMIYISDFNQGCVISNDEYSSLTLSNYNY